MLKKGFYKKNSPEEEVPEEYRNGPYTEREELQMKPRICAIEHVPLEATLVIAAHFSSWKHICRNLFQWKHNSYFHRYVRADSISIIFIEILTLYKQKVSYDLQFCCLPISLRNGTWKYRTKTRLPQLLPKQRIKLSRESTISYMKRITERVLLKWSLEAKEHLAILWGFDTHAFR